MTAYYNEIDPQAAQWLRNLIAAGMIAPGDVDERSIIDVRPDDLRGYTQCHFFAGIGVWSYALRQAGWSDDRPVWTGSCPCQPFSAAGVQAGFADERHLWPHFHYLIEQCRPAEVFGEQVASKAVEPWIDLVQTDLEAVGYAFAGIPFPSAGVGAPHIRDRLFWVGHTDEPGSQGHSGYVGAARWEGSSGSAAPAGVSGGLGHPGSSRRQPQPTDIRIDGEGMESSRGQPVARVKTSGDVSIGLADSDSEQRHGSRIIRPGGRAEPADGGAIARREPPAGPTNGFWGTADWLFCRDGKWRPVGPGTFPLVDGAPARVVRLRAYGNAINAEAAKEFIASYMEATMYTPVNGNYDAQLTAEMKRNQNAVVGWLLMASWCYYIEPTPCSLLSDTLYDKASAWLLRHYDKVTHQYKHLLPPETLAAGTAYHLTSDQYPRGIVRMAQIARDVLENS